MKHIEGFFSFMCDWFILMLLLNLGWLHVEFGASAAWTYGIMAVICLVVSASCKRCENYAREA